MTPANPDALADSLVNQIARILDPDAHHLGRPDYYGPEQILAFSSARVRVARQTASSIIAGPLASILADLQRVTAERDALCDQAGRLVSIKQMQQAAAQIAEFQAALATAEARAAQLQAEVEAKDRAIAVLTEAMEPFARFGNLATPDTAETWAGTYHNLRISTRFNHEHFRAARAATAREGQTHTPASGALKIKEADRDA